MSPPSANRATIFRKGEADISQLSSLLSPVLHTHPQSLENNRCVYWARCDMRNSEHRDRSTGHVNLSCRFVDSEKLMVELGTTK